MMFRRALSVVRPAFCRITLAGTRERFPLPNAVDASVMGYYIAFNSCFHGVNEYLSSLFVIVINGIFS